MSRQCWIRRQCFPQLLQIAVVRRKRIADVIIGKTFLRDDESLITRNGAIYSWKIIQAFLQRGVELLPESRDA